MANIQSANRNYKPFRSDSAQLGIPVRALPTPIVSNIMFWVDRQINNVGELDAYNIGDLYIPTGVGDENIEAYSQAVLTHWDRAQGMEDSNVYRFYYIVPFEQQYLYNIKQSEKCTDGYTLDTNGEPKQFWKIVREFAVKRGDAYTPAQIKDYDPSGDIDAQLVNETVVQFDEDYLDKYFVKIVREYWTIPHAVIRNASPTSIYQKGDTAFKIGGEGTPYPWYAQVADDYYRVVWAEEEDAEGKRFIPPMPPECARDKIRSQFWMKGDYSSIQEYHLSDMMTRYTGRELDGNRETIQSTCCVPPNSYVKCENTTSSKSSQTIFNDEIAPLPPFPVPDDACVSYRADVEVSHRDGSSVQETSQSCTTYEITEWKYESRFDSMTGMVVPVTKHITKDLSNPPTGQVNPDGTYTIRTMVNGCWAEDTTTTVEGTGYYRAWFTHMEYSFPPVLKNLELVLFTTQAQDNNRFATQIYPHLSYDPSGYRGFCRAYVEEKFCADGQLPTGWEVGLNEGFILNDYTVANPFFSFSISGLYSARNVRFYLNADDAKYQSFDYTWQLPGTKDTAWKQIKFVQGRPHAQGIIYRRTTIYPPSLT